MSAVCEVCGAPTERELRIPLFDGKGGYTTETVRCLCKCQVKKRDEEEEKFRLNEERLQIEKLKRVSLMDAKFKDVKFENLVETEQNKRAIQIARKYVDDFHTMFKERQGLLFWGEPGTGKSYLSAAIANELMENMHPSVMTSFVKLIPEMNEFDGNNKYIDMLSKAKLVVLDDFGTERNTDYALEKVYNIIDSRYRSGKPVIITTNLSLNEMKESDDIRYARIYDRIFEMCYPVRFTGKSWRKREAVNRFEAMKARLEE